jgi:hypothetical protein
MLAIFRELSLAGAVNVSIYILEIPHMIKL